MPWVACRLWPDLGWEGEREKRRAERETNSSSTSHCAQQTAVDLDDLLDRLRRNPVPRRRPRVRRDDDAALESKRQRRRSVRDLDGAVWVGVVVCCGAEP